MPTRSWAKLLPLLAATLLGCAAARSTIATQQVTIVAEGQKITFTASLDRTLIAPTGEHEVQVLGVRRGLALVLDSYASRPAGLSRCQAGQERYVRLIDLRQKQERFARLADSCLRDIVAGDPPAAWTTDSRAFTVNLISEPSVRVLVDAAGRTQVADR